MTKTTPSNRPRSITLADGRTAYRAPCYDTVRSYGYHIPSRGGIGEVLLLTIDRDGNAILRDDYARHVAAFRVRDTVAVDMRPYRYPTADELAFAAIEEMRILQQMGPDPMDYCRSA